ncbi:MAG: hypothetical protein AAEJ65_09910 [Planctomycetota bacterium]|jgi:hypothetical protein
MKILLALLLFALALFCVYGFLASAEASDPSEQFRWRSGYTMLGLVSLGGAMALLRGKRSTDDDR